MYVIFFFQNGLFERNNVYFYLVSEIIVSHFIKERDVNLALKEPIRCIGLTREDKLIFLTGKHTVPPTRQY